MQFNLEQANGQLIQGFTHGALEIAGVRYDRSLLILPHEIRPHWPCEAVADLTLALLQPVLDAAPEVFLLGTGARQTFPSVALRVELARHQRSVEVMDTAAACRTYNVLVGEFRKVAAAIIL